MQVIDNDASPVQQSQQAAEALEPSVMERPLKFTFNDPNTGQPAERVYIQGQLGFFPSQEFGTIIGAAIEQFTSGEMGENIGALFRGEVEAPIELNENAVNDFISENMAMVQALLLLIRKIPELELDIIVLSLGVPRRERDWAKLWLQEAPSRGGLSFDDGADILKVFIIQNAELIREKAMGKARDLVDTFRLHVLRETPEASSSSTDSMTSGPPNLTTVPTPASPGGTPSSTSSPATPESV